MKNDVNKRFLEVLEYLKTNNIIESQKVFCEDIGIVQQTIGDIKSNKRSVTLEMAVNTCNTYNISEKWLLSGVGKMFNSLDDRNLNNTISETEKEVRTNVRSNVRTNYEIENKTPHFLREEGATLYVQSTKMQNTVYWVQQSAYAGLVSGFSQEQLEAQQTFSIPTLARGTYYALSILGNSMYPTVANGDIAVCSPVESVEWVRNNEVYVVITEDGILCKRLKKGTGEFITIISDNPEFGEDSIPLRFVLKIYRVVMYITGVTESRYGYLQREIEYLRAGNGKKG